MGAIVWIIEDDIVSQFATEYCIQQANKDAFVKTFDNVEESLQNFEEAIESKEDIPQIILLDLVMPKMDGWQFLKELEKFVGWKDKVNVYIISAFAKSSDRELAKNHAFVKGYFDKPLSRVSADKIFSSIKI
jgi:CheY-like chemotaxis protein